MSLNCMKVEWFGSMRMHRVWKLIHPIRAVPGKPYQPREMVLCHGFNWLRYCRLLPGFRQSVKQGLQRTD